MENKPKRFKKFLKRMNRGVAIGLALVIILVGYSIVDGAVFENKHRGDIEELVREYGVDVIKINEAIKETNIGERLTANDKAGMRVALEEVIGKYYTSSKDALRTYGRNSQNGIELLEKFDESASNIRGFKLESVEVMLPTANSYGYVYSDMNMSKLARHLDMGRASLYRALDSLEESSFISRENNVIKISSPEEFKKIYGESL